MILGLLYFLSLSAWAQVQPFNYVELMNLLPETTEYKTTNIYQQNPRLHRDRVQALLPAIRNNQSLYQTNADIYAGHMQRLHGKNTDRVKQMSHNDLTDLRGILLRYDCARSLPSGAPTNCSGSNQSRMVPLTDHEKRLLLPLGFTNAELDGQLNDDNRMKFTHLLYQTDFQLQTQRLKDAQARAQEAIAHYNQQQADAENRQAEISEACQRYLRSVEGKVASPAASNSSQKMPTRISSQQARPYIEGLHQAHVQAQTIPNAEARINRFQELRNAAEILSCNGHRQRIAQLVPELDNSLKKSLFTGNNDCNNADQSDRLYTDRSTCVAGFLDALPSGRGEFVTNVEQVNRHLLNLTPSGVLEQLQEDQTKQARDNLAYMNALYDLGPGPRAPLPAGTVTNSNCGGADYNRARQEYGRFIRNLSQRNQFTAMSKEQKEEALSAELGQFIERASSAYPGFGALAYSPGFLSSYNLNLDDMSVEENDVSCSDVKNAMHSTLEQSIEFIRRPPQNRADQSIARASQTTKRFLSDLLTAQSYGMVQIPTASYAEIDQLYREIPELEKYPRDQIHHLKSLIRHRPEMRAQYMKQFEGNSRLICFLYKASEKDAIRDRIVQKETKFVKGVAKGVGLALSVASFAVNPALGMVLTAASMGATAVSHTATIGNLQSQLDNVKNHQGAVLNQCIENMMRNPSSDQNLASSQCSDAVTTARRIDVLAEELAGAEKAAKIDAALYLVYVAQAAPHLLHEGHHGMALVEMFKSSRTAITAAQTAGAPAGRAILQSIVSVAAHRPADVAYEVTKVAKLAYYTYATAKYGSYLSYVNNEQHAYHYYLMDEEVANQRRTLGRGLNPTELETIENRVTQRVGAMSLGQVREEIGMINSTNSGS